MDCATNTRTRTPALRTLGLSVFVAASMLLPAPQIEAARTCTITVFPLGFGNYPPATPTPVDSTALIQVSCNGNPDPGQPGFYTVRIDGGTSGDPANRYMPSGPNQLDYNLYQDAAYTTIWGDGTSGTSPVVQALPAGMGMGMGAPFNMDHTVYGRSFSSQDPPPGAYADVPIVTIEF